MRARTPQRFLRYLRQGLLRPFGISPLARFLFSSSRFLRPSSISLPISEPLADDTTERGFEARFIVNAECDAVVVPKIKLGKVAMQMGVAALLICAAHPAFKDREISFDGVRMHDAILLVADILASR